MSSTGIGNRLDRIGLCPTSMNAAAPSVTSASRWPSSPLLHAASTDGKRHARPATPPAMRSCIPPDLGRTPEGAAKSTTRMSSGRHAHAADESVPCRRSVSLEERPTCGTPYTGRTARRASRTLRWNGSAPTRGVLRQLNVAPTWPHTASLSSSTQTCCVRKAASAQSVASRRASLVMASLCASPSTTATTQGKSADSSATDATERSDYLGTTPSSCARQSATCSVTRKEQQYKEGSSHQ